MTGKITQLTKVMKTIGDKKVDRMDMPADGNITSLICAHDKVKMDDKRQITGKIKASTHRFQIKDVAQGHIQPLPCLH